MKINDILISLGFTSQWFDLILSDKEIISQVIEAYQENEDSHSEHYRWLAFDSFITKNKNLASDQISELYFIGTNDPDVGVGSAILFALIQLDNCPSNILREILKSDRKRLHKYAKRVLETKA